MARPQRSPRVREHWRDDDNRGEGSDRWGRPRERSNERRRRPASRQRERSIDDDVKIKASANIERSHRPVLRKYEADRHREPSEHAPRRGSRSPRRRKRREGSYDHYRDLSENRYHHHTHRQRDHRPAPFDRRRSRSRSPYQTSQSYRERRESPALYTPRHTDRGSDTRTGYKKLYCSRPSTPRGANHHDPLPEDSVAGDFYVPSARRHRSRSPFASEHRQVDAHQRSSRAPRITHTIDRRPPLEEDDLFYGRISRRRERSVDTTARRSQASSRSRYQRESHVKRSPDRSRKLSDRHSKRARVSRSPIESDNNKRKMHSTHRIEVLDSTSRPQSSPRPIPSFDAGGQYPMGPTDAHGPNRPAPLQVNTQYPHSASPQWTPVSSHHGSPHSASPYSHGRGGWPGQPQQYYGHPA